MTRGCSTPKNAARDSFARTTSLQFPDYASGNLAQNVPWIVRPGGKLNFWEQMQFRDPRPDTIHATLPGHAFDGLILGMTRA